MNGALQNALAEAHMIDAPEINAEARQGWRDATREHGRRWLDMADRSDPYAVGYLAACDYADYNGDWND